MNKESGSICDLVISKHLDILAITETWISGSALDNNTVAEILNTLNDFQFHDIPRQNRTGGGIGILQSYARASQFKRKTVLRLHLWNIWTWILAMVKSSIRLVTIYRPPPSKKNRVIPTIFFNEFSTLLEMLTLAPGYLLINGDFNFHMDVPTDASKSALEDLLESAGLKQHVVGPTHRSGHTLDLIIDQQDDTVWSSFATLSDLPSDHYALLCSVAFSKPVASKSQYKQRHLKDIDLDAFRADIIKSPLLSEHTSDPNKLADLYNSELQQLLDKHAPEMSRSITLRPHAPWYSAKLRDSKREKRRYERAYRSSGLEVHRQIYRDQCRKYSTLLDGSKTQYYRYKIESVDQRQLFRLIDRMFKVKPIPILPSHTQYKMSPKGLALTLSTKWRT